MRKQATMKLYQRLSILTFIKNLVPGHDKNCAQNETSLQVGPALGTIHEIFETLLFSIIIVCKKQ